MRRKILITILTGIMLGMTWSGFADDDDHKHGHDDEHGKKWSITKMFSRKSGVAAVNNPSYIEECSSCHFTYQPGLLPSRSWEKIMSNLEDHFGDNAELDAPVQKELLRYLVDNGADRSGHRRSKKIMRTIGTNDTPMRITEVRYFKRKHDEIPNRMVVTNKKVRSIGNCETCHTRADKGSFSEREIDIPGFGQWED